MVHSLRRLGRLAFLLEVYTLSTAYVHSLAHYRLGRRRERTIGDVFLGAELLAGKI